jgi:hypothetical protein
MTERARLWARSGLVWVLVGMAAGMQIGAAGEYGASSHHAHAGLLGGLWAIAFAFLFDRNGAPLTAAAKVQWALYHLGIAGMAVAMYVVARHGGIAGLFVGIAGLVVMLTTAWIVVSAWPRGAAA